MTAKPVTAAQSALTKARRHLGASALAAAIVPLSSVIVHASVAIPTPTITATVTNNGSGSYIYDYHVANLTGGTISLDGIEIPELTAGDLNFGVFTQPNGWSATQQNTAQFPGSFAGAKNGTRSAAYVDLIYSGGTGSYALSVNPVVSPNPGAPGSYTLEANGSIDFDAESFVSATTPANVSVEIGNSGSPSYEQVDPPIPNSAPAVSPIPEPASVAIFGAGIMAVFARKRRNT